MPDRTATLKAYVDQDLHHGIVGTPLVVLPAVTGLEGRISNFDAGQYDIFLDPKIIGLGRHKITFSLTETSTGPAPDGTPLGVGIASNQVFFVTVDDIGPPMPVMPFCALETRPWTIAKGESATLLYSTKDATSVSMDNGIGPVPAGDQGAIWGVSPETSTTYTMTATNDQGSSTCQISVTVDGVAAPPPPPPPPPPPAQRFTCAGTVSGTSSDGVHVSQTGNISWSCTLDQ
jgi:hypothetical protein